MNRTLPSLALPLLATIPWLLLPDPLYSQDRAVTPPVGYEKIEIVGGGNSQIALPLMQRMEGIGRVAGLEQDSVTVALVHWQQNQFAKGDRHFRYYAEFMTGPWTGVTYPIRANGENHLELQTDPPGLLAHPLGFPRIETYDGLERLTEGDLIAVRSYWTVGSVFGDGEEAVLQPFTSYEDFTGNEPGDRIFFPDPDGTGDSPGAREVIGRIADAGWRNTESETSDQASAAFPPASVLITSRSSPHDVEVVAIGHVRTIRSVIPIPGGDGLSGNLVYLANPFSHPIALTDSALHAALITPSPSLMEREDEFLVLGPYGMPLDLLPERLFVLLSGSGWTEVGGSTEPFSLDPGQGYLLRLRPSSTGGLWLQFPNF